jgi:hypothetical protein
MLSLVVGVPFAPISSGSLLPLQNPRSECRWWLCSAHGRHKKVFSTQRQNWISEQINHGSLR